MKWATGEDIGQFLCCIGTKVEGQNVKLYCLLCAVWVSSQGAIFKEHVLGKNKKGIRRCIVFCTLMGFATL